MNNSRRYVKSFQEYLLENENCLSLSESKTKTISNGVTVDMAKSYVEKTMKTVVEPMLKNMYKKIDDLNREFKKEGESDDKCNALFSEMKVQSNPYNKEVRKKIMESYPSKIGDSCKVDRDDILGSFISDYGLFAYQQGLISKSNYKKTGNDIKYVNYNLNAVSSLFAHVIIHFEKNLINFAFGKNTTVSDLKTVLINEKTDFKLNYKEGVINFDPFENTTSVNSDFLNELYAGLNFISDRLFTDIRKQSLVSLKSGVLELAIV